MADDLDPRAAAVLQLGAEIGQIMGRATETLRAVGEAARPAIERFAALANEVAALRESAGEGDEP